MNALLHQLRRLRRLHVALLLPVAACLAIGVAFIYSACFISEDVPVKALYLKQLMWIGVGAALHLGVGLSDYRRLGRRSWLLYAATLVLLALVLLAGPRIYGARRWLFLPGTRTGVQPSEFAKLATIILAARLLSRPDVDIRRFRTFAWVLGLTALPLLLVMKQPDLGTAIVFMPPILLMMFVAGVPLRYVGGLVAAGLLAAAAMVAAIAVPEALDMDEAARARIERAVPLTEYQKERILVLLWPDRDPLGAGWNKNQSLIAVGSGGLRGKGYLHGTQNILGFLPRSVAPTDFVYSVIAEETGFAGSAAILLLFGLLAVCGLHIAVCTPDRMGRLLCVGIVTMIVCHVCVNIAMTVGLVPVVGLPLPLMSYGGSFLLTVLGGLGILQSVYICSPQRFAG
jgi:rod shape determining protein RodA